MNINLDYLWQMEQVAKSCAIFRGNDFWERKKNLKIFFEKLTNFGLKSNWLRINPLFELQLPLAKENRSFWRFRFSCPGATASSGQKVDIFWQLSEWTFFLISLLIARFLLVNCKILSRWKILWRSFLISCKMSCYHDSISNWMKLVSRKL